MPPPPRFLPAHLGLFQAGLRGLAWATGVLSVLLLAYVGKSWPSKGQVVVAGIMGSVIAMLNDSWEVVALTDTWQTLPRLSTSRRVLHDLFSLALCIGGMIMMWVSNIHIGNDSKDMTSDERQQDKYLMTALWALLAQIAWRFILAVWGCVDCSRDARAADRRRRRRRRRRNRPPLNDPWYEITGYRI
ncbi:hypothetical protein QQZ08_006283 [Neonectria magnoliae]|uniref:Uncharacterized protein n=1 Tax=Neonectria magnoliae TaxID=2732573 RepID=A0ABR1I0V3_9HYPO